MLETLAPRRSAGKILVVEDMVATRAMLVALLSDTPYAVLTAENGVEGLAVAIREAPDLVLTDWQMPEGDGIGLCRALKGDPATRLIPVVIMTGSVDAGHRIEAIEAGADDFLTKPIDPLELQARVRSLVSLKRFTDDLDRAEVVLRSLALMIEARDAGTLGHCERLAKYAVELGRALRLQAADLVTLERGGYFHDLGKIAIPDAILLKRGALSAEERRTMEEHPAIGERLVGELRALRQVRPIIRSHHERLDGSGYPDGLRGDDVPLLAQIIGIVDVYDALTSDRPYRPALDEEAARRHLIDEVTRGWRRRDLVEQFLKLRHS